MLCYLAFQEVTPHEIALRPDPTAHRLSVGLLYQRAAGDREGSAQVVHPHGRGRVLD